MADTTHAEGEEEIYDTTMAVGEEDTTHAVGEEGGETTDAIGEEEPAYDSASTTNPFGSF